MTAISIEEQVSTDQLLRAVERLPSQELATFVAQVVALRAQIWHPTSANQKRGCCSRSTRVFLLKRSVDVTSWW